MYTLSLADTYADPHVYRVTRKWYWSRRESHSINTPRCLLRPHPQERRCTPSTPLLSLLFLSLFLFLCRSLLYLPDYPSTTWPTCSPTPEKGTIRWKRAFGRPKTREGNTSLSRKFFDTHSDVNDVKKI